MNYFYKRLHYRKNGNVPNNQGGKIGGYTHELAQCVGFEANSLELVAYSEGNGSPHTPEAKLEFTYEGDFTLEVPEGGQARIKIEKRSIVITLNRVVYTFNPRI